MTNPNQFDLDAWAASLVFPDVGSVQSGSAGGEIGQHLPGERINEINTNDLVCALTPESDDLVELAIFQQQKSTVVVRLDKRRSALIGQALMDWSGGRLYDGPATVIYEVAGLADEAEAAS